MGLPVPFQIVERNGSFCEAAVSWAGMLSRQQRQAEQSGAAYKQAGQIKALVASGQVKDHLLLLSFFSPTYFYLPSHILT